MSVGFETLHQMAGQVGTGCRHRANQEALQIIKAHSQADPLGVMIGPVD